MEQDTQEKEEVEEQKEEDEDKKEEQEQVKEKTRLSPDDTFLYFRSPMDCKRSPSLNAGQGPTWPLVASGNP